jgi:hypothetical protein
MKDARSRKIAIPKMHHPPPRHRRALAATHQRTLPELSNPYSKEHECSIVRRYRVVGVETPDHLREPSPLSRYGLVPSAL